MSDRDKIFKFVEPFLFYVMVLVGLLPLFSRTWFVTLDGPSHLYNGTLIKDLLTGHSQNILEIFKLNPFPLPNSFTHVLFALFSTFLPGFLTEKAVIFLYLFFTPVIFRKIILHLAPRNGIFSWLMILFVHNQNFYFGFFNLVFGILCMFLTVLYFYRSCREIRNRQIIILSLLFLVTWFSHFFTFLISLAVILCSSMVSTTIRYSAEGLKISGIRKNLLNTVKILVAALPAIILSLAYLIKVDSVESAPRPELKQLFEWILDVRPLLAISDGFPWKSYTYLLFALFILMMISHLISWIRKSFRREENTLLFTGSFQIQAFVWFAFTFGFLLLYLILPNAILLTERLILFFFLFLITWLSILAYPKWLKYATFIVIVIVHIAFTRLYYKTIGELSGDIVMMKEAVKEVEPGSILLTLNYHDNWLHSHTSGYIGCDKPVAVLENYEAGLDWFPVQWNHDHYQIDFLDQWGTENKKILCEKYLQTEAPDLFSLKRTDNRIVPIPYILITGNLEKNKENFPACLMNILNASYTIVDQKTFCTLFKLNKSYP